MPTARCSEGLVWQEAAERVAKVPLTRACPGQRVIIKTPNIIGRTINGERGTVVEWAGQDKWKVELWRQGRK